MISVNNVKGLTCTSVRKSIYLLGKTDKQVFRVWTNNIRQIYSNLSGNICNWFKKRVKIEIFYQLCHNKCHCVTPASLFDRVPTTKRKKVRVHEGLSCVQTLSESGDSGGKCPPITAFILRSSSHWRGTRSACTVDRLPRGPARETTGRRSQDLWVSPLAFDDINVSLKHYFTSWIK